MNVRLVKPAAARHSAGLPGGDPLLNRYLDELREVLELWQAPPSAVAEILGEIESHVAEAGRHERHVSEVLRSLGPASELAQEYGAALLLDRRRTGSRAWRLLAAFGAWWLRLATTGLLGLLLLVGVLLCALGVLGIVAAIVLPFLPPEVLEPTLRSGLPQFVVLVVSGAVALLGVQSLRWLGVNVRLARSTVWRRRRVADDRRESPWSRPRIHSVRAAPPKPDTAEEPGEPA